MRARRHGSGLDEAEAEAGQSAQRFRVLVEACRHAEWIRKAKARNFDGERLVVERAIRAREAEAEREHGEAVSALGIEPTQGRRESGSEGGHHPSWIRCGQPDGKGRRCPARRSPLPCRAMWNQPYLETCCRSALHRLALCGSAGRPATEKDRPCLERLATMDLAQSGADGRFRLTLAGLARHQKEILGQVPHGSEPSDIPLMRA